MSKEDNVREHFYTHEEYLAMQKVAEEKYPYLVGPIRFAYTIGWRSSAIRNITWSWVDMKEQSIYLPANHSKNKQALWVKLPESIFRMFRTAHKNRRLGCEYVFHRNGKQIKDFRRAWSRILEAVGIEDGTFHDFRRCAVRNLVRAGVDRSTAMLITGHKTESVFERYNISDESILEEAAAKLDRYHSRLNGTEH